MCSGRVDLKFLLKAFSNGCDGVFVGGCRLGECNYITQGNYHALNTVLLCKRLMEHVGLSPERVKIAFMSSAEGMRFVEKVSQLSDEIKGLGPIGEKEGLDRDELSVRLEGVMNLIPYIKRIKREKLETRLENEDQYEALFTSDEIEQLFREIPSYAIDPEECQACMICERRCPVEAIAGGKGLIHVIDQDKCIKCGTCLEACPPRFGAVEEIRGGPVPPAIPEEKRRLIRPKKNEKR